ncbi:MAG: hypothetical protein EOM50_06705 [Erysipelotrichia bacterium]|nr:hypothetical protein [Erysipelotrichia bacterium]NCC55571.1 hypothetical protein [Erysipelotrichia bacterium]
MKQDKILFFIFLFIGVYLCATAIFLITLQMTIAYLSAFVLCVLAIVFITIAYKFYCLSKKEVASDTCLDREFSSITEQKVDENKDVDDVEKHQNKILVTSPRSLVREEDEQVKEEIKDSIEEVSQEEINKQKMLDELAMLKKQQMMNKTKMLSIVYDENTRCIAKQKFYTLTFETTQQKGEISLQSIQAALFSQQSFQENFDIVLSEDKQKQRIDLLNLLMFLNDACYKNTFVCIYKQNDELVLFTELLREHHLEAILYYVDVKPLCINDEKLFEKMDSKAIGEVLLTL